MSAVPVLPSVQAAIRQNVVNAILALPNLPNIPVEMLLVYTDVFYRGYRTGIGVCAPTEDWLDVDKGLNDFLDRQAEMPFHIAVYSTSELSPTGALLPDDGQIDGLVSLILGSNHPGYGRGIRNTDVGVAGVTGEVRCRAISSAIVADPKRAEGSGGGVAKILTMRTTTLAL